MKTAIWRFLLVPLVALTVSATIEAANFLDHDVPPDWRMVWLDGGSPNANISADGKYVAYTIGAPRCDALGTYVVQATGRAWKREIPNAASPSCRATVDGYSQGTLTTDSARYIFKHPTEGIGILRLADDQLSYVKDAETFIVPEHGSGRWLLYKAGAAWTLLDLWAGTERRFSGVQGDSIRFNPDGSALVFYAEDAEKAVSALTWLDLHLSKATVLCRDCSVNSWDFDRSGSRIAFVAKESKDAQARASLSYFSVGMTGPRTLADSTTFEMNGMELKAFNRFSADGGRVFFTVERVSVKEAKDARPSTSHAHVRVLAPLIGGGAAVTPEILATRAVAPGGNVVLLEAPEASQLADDISADGQYLLFEEPEGHAVESLEGAGARTTSYIVSSRNGASRLVARHLLARPDVRFH